jgi:serine/threonine-protein kinase
MDLVAGTIVADRFRLERELGAGGMGAVWLAQHLGLGVPCALKFILAGAAREPELRARFEREAKAAAHIKSPYVVQILDCGVWDQTPYIAMEYLEGEDLAARLARRGRLTPKETAVIVGQVARALGKAHAMGIVHRDIKPSNIFLARDDEQEVTKVVDFGIAKSHSQAIGEGQTRTGALLGTPCYMSPEQAQGTRAVDHRSDLWALGVVTYQCLTGRLPFQSDGFGDLMLKIMIEPIPVPSTVAPVPPGFDAWWARAVARDPAQRFQSARELAEALYLALDISAGTAAELRESSPSLSSPPPPEATAATVAGSATPVPTPRPATPMPSAPAPMAPGPSPWPTTPMRMTGPATPLPAPRVATPLPMTGPVTPVPAAPSPWPVPPMPTPTPGGAAVTIPPAPHPGKGLGVAIAATLGVLVIAGGAALAVRLRGGSPPTPAAPPTAAQVAVEASAPTPPPPPTTTASAPAAPPSAAADAPPAEDDGGVATPTPTAAPRGKIRAPRQCKAAGQRCIDNDDCCTRACRAWTCQGGSKGAGKRK